MRQRSGYRQSGSETGVTELERSILAAYATGLRRIEIGRQVGLAERTVGAYLTAVKEKLGARNLVHAAALIAARSDP